MKRILLSALLIAGLGLGYLLLNHTLALGQGGSSFSNRDLRGDYLVTALEIRYTFVPPSTTPSLNFCENAGTASFDGAGTVTTNLVRRCSVLEPSPPPTVATATYSVSPDGSFVIPDPADPASVVHGQIANGRHALLLDGTMMTNPNILAFNGVAMKR